MSNKVLCACCNKQIEDEFLTVGDNYLQIKYFEEEDGSDNIFCSDECLKETLSVQTFDVKELSKWNTFWYILF